MVFVYLLFVGGLHLQVPFVFEQLFVCCSRENLRAHSANP